MAEPLLKSSDGHTLVLTFNRPDKLNALSTTLLTTLVEALDAADADGSVRGVVITGNEKSFSTGVDLNEALRVSEPLEMMRWLTLHRRVNERIETLSKPVVALIQGHCYTGGLEMAMACDLRVAERGSRYAITSSRIGSVAGMGGTQRLPRIVGRSKAKDILMSGRFFEAEEAHECGLVDRLCAPGEGYGEAKRWLDECAARAPMSVWFAKWAVNTGMDMDINAALDFEFVLSSRTFATEDRTEGMQAVLDKRQPQFKGR